MNAVEFCNRLESDLYANYRVPVRVVQEKVLAGSDYRFIVYETLTSSNQIGFVIDLDWYNIRLELDSPDYFVKSCSIYDLWRNRLRDNRSVAEWYHSVLCKKNGHLSYYVNGHELVLDSIDDEMFKTKWHLFNLIFDDSSICTNINLDIQYNVIYPIIELFWGLVLAFTSECIDEQVECFNEGTLKNVSSVRYERSSVNRKACIAIHGTKCKICGFDFEEIYGDIGKDFIEVHHIEPVSSFEKPRCVNPKKDLIPVCSNCHSVLHRRIPPYHPTEIKRIIKGNKDDF